MPAHGPGEPGERRHTRVRSGLVLAADGRFLHDGTPIEHPGIERAFHRGLERAPDGRYLLRFGDDWAYVTVQDAPYQVRRALPREGAVWLDLDDGSTEPLAPATLAASADGVLYARVKGDHRARFSRQAQADLLPLLAERDGRPALVLPGGVFPVGGDPGSPPPRPEDGPAPP